MWLLILVLAALLVLLIISVVEFIVELSIPNSWAHMFLYNRKVKKLESKIVKLKNKKIEFMHMYSENAVKRTRINENIQKLQVTIQYKEQELARVHEIYYQSKSL